MVHINSYATEDKFVNLFEVVPFLQMADEFHILDLKVQVCEQINENCFLNMCGSKKSLLEQYNYEFPQN